jgi:hypothetical protein
LAEKGGNLHFDVNNSYRSMCGLDLPVISVKHCLSRLLQGQIRKFIVINARTHPGETSASWVLDGLLNELVNSG